MSDPKQPQDGGAYRLWDSHVYPPWLGVTVSELPMRASDSPPEQPREGASQAQESLAERFRAEAATAEASGLHGTAAAFRQMAEDEERENARKGTGKP